MRGRERDGWVEQCMPGGCYNDGMCVVWAGYGDDEKALDGNFTIFGEEFLGSKTKKRVKRLRYCIQVWS